MKLILCGVGSLIRAPSLSFSRKLHWKLLSLSGFTIHERTGMGAVTLLWLYLSPLDPGMRSPALGSAFQRPHISHLCGGRSQWGYGEEPTQHLHHLALDTVRTGALDFLLRWLKSASRTCEGRYAGSTYAAGVSIPGQEKEGRCQRAALCKWCGQSLEVQVGVLVSMCIRCIII